MIHKEILKSDRYQQHGKLLYTSFEQLTGSTLLKSPKSSPSLIEQLFDAPFVLLSHDTQDDPIFNFGNQRALDYFEISWDALLQMPSRLSAEPINRAERARLIKAVTDNGYIDNYSGVRISAKGNRFIIDKAIVWNLLDSQGVYHGQAAMFHTIRPCE